MPARSGERPPRPRPAPKAPEKQPAGRHIDVREIEDESSVKITHDRTSYKEFKEKQEELWGANDKLDAKDVPDGELTWEQYLAMRPKAEADDVMHYGGKVRSAETGQFASKAKYEARREDISADDHYDKINLKRDIEDAHEEALKENKTFDAKMSETVKANTEGELLVAKDPRLQAVLGLGRELLELQSKKASPNKYEKKIKSEFETKELMFNELMRLYKLDGADARALGYIENVTEQLRDFDKAPVKPEVTYNGAQVTVTGMEETAGGTKVYDITLEDGTTRKAVAADLEFSRDYTAPEAEKGNVVERIKEWFSKERKSIQQYGGMAWFSAKFDRIKRGLNDRTLNYGVEDSMSAEQKDKLRRRNRVIAIAAGAALAGAAIFAISQGLSHGSDVSATDLPTDLGSGTGGAAGTELGSEAAAVGTGTSGVENLPLLSDVPDTSGVETAPPPDTSSGIETVPTPLPGEFFNVPSGQGGEALFTNLGIDPSKWYANEDTLLAQFPDDFYRMGDGHVGIAHSGWLSQGAQDFINTLR